MADRERIEARLEALWAIARGPGGGADRPAYSPAEAAGLELVAGWAREAGLEPGIDRFGNLWALPAGASTGATFVTAGSHVDTVPDGGRYDGALGTVLGLELACQVPGCGLMVCAAEEAPRFGAGTIGSRLLTGALSESALEGLLDPAGVQASQARETFLALLAELPRVAPPLAGWRAHAEIHVAQRRALRELGVVTRVAAPRRFAVTLSGRAGHSGEVSMAERRDALAAASELVLAVESAAWDEPAETVATVGVLTVSPGAVSVIPGSVELAIDARAISTPSLDRLSDAIRDAAAGIGERRGVSVAVSLVRDGAPVALDGALARAALAEAATLGVAAVETWSGAGHDAQHLAALTPTLLLFVPLHGGESHTPAEGASPEQSLDALRVAGGVLRALGASDSDRAG